MSASTLQGFVCNNKLQSFNIYGSLLQPYKGSSVTLLNFGEGAAFTQLQPYKGSSVTRRL